jgi:Fe-S cluster biogenesis protein NfuA/nitrite reductase/ring-hydroxylating ferredoxin subunit
MLKEREFQTRMQQVEQLIRELEADTDPGIRARIVELVQLLMDFHGAGLERVMEIVAEAGAPGDAIFGRLAKDELVASLLLLYGLHPLDLETRVINALDSVRPYLQTHGGNVELLSVDDGVVRLRLAGNCKGCPSSEMTFKLAIEEAILKAAPDVSFIQVEGRMDLSAPNGLIQLGHPQTRAPSGDGHGQWEEVGDLQSFSQNSVKILEVSGRPVLFCRTGDNFYAFANLCPACGQTLNEAYLETARLVCPNCGQRFDCKQAGRGLDQLDIYLEPYPLLLEQDRARVALPFVTTS